MSYKKQGVQKLDNLVQKGCMFPVHSGSLEVEGSCVFNLVQKDGIHNRSKNDGIDEIKTQTKKLCLFSSIKL